MALTIFRLAIHEAVWRGLVGDCCSVAVAVGVIVAVVVHLSAPHSLRIEI